MPSTNLETIMGGGVRYFSMFLIKANFERSSKIVYMSF